MSLAELFYEAMSTTEEEPSELGSSTEEAEEVAAAPVAAAPPVAVPEAAGAAAALAAADAAPAADPAPGGLHFMGPGARAVLDDQGRRLGGCVITVPLTGLPRSIGRNDLAELLETDVQLRVSRRLLEFEYLRLGDEHGMRVVLCKDHPHSVRVVRERDGLALSYGVTRHLWPGPEWLFIVSLHVHGVWVEAFRFYSFI